MTAATLDSAAIAQYLVDHPQFFEEYAGLLGEVKLSSPLTGRAVSLQERQMEVMRDKYKALELRMAELMRHAEENAAIANRFHGWTRQCCRRARRSAGRDAARRGRRPVQHFMVPQATLRLWTWRRNTRTSGMRAACPTTCACSPTACARPTAARTAISKPCSWLEDGTDLRPTGALDRAGAAARRRRAFGLLVLGSPDPERFSAAWRPISWSTSAKRPAPR
jgi:uncharacterized protein YigA (DUF484 family)